MRLHHLAVWGLTALSLVACNEVSPAPVAAPTCTSARARSSDDLMATGEALCGAQTLVASLTPGDASTAQAGSVQVKFRPLMRGDLEVCFDDDNSEPHVAELVASSGSIVRVVADEPCKTVQVEDATYELRFTHHSPGAQDLSPDVVHTTLTFPTLGRSGRLDIATNRCVGCDLSGTEMPLLVAGTLQDEGTRFLAVYGYSGDYSRTTFADLRLPSRRPSAFSTACAFGYQVNGDAQSFRGATFGNRNTQGSLNCAGHLLLGGPNADVDFSGAYFVGLSALETRIRRATLTGATLNRFEGPLRSSDSIYRDVAGAFLATRGAGFAGDVMDEAFLGPLLRSGDDTASWLTPTFDVGAAGPVSVSVNGPFLAGSATRRMGRSEVNLDALRLSLVSKKLMKSDFRNVLLNQLALGDADLTSAKFDKAVLGELETSKATIDAASFEHAQIGSLLAPGSGAKGTVFKYATITSLSAPRADLSNANFYGAVIRQLDLSGATLKSTAFEGFQATEARFVSANMDNANFTSTTLAGPDFTEAYGASVNFNGSVFSDAKFLGSNLTGADLTNATFTTTNFSGARLFSAKLISTSLRGSDLRNTYLCGADLGGVQLDEVSLAGAFTPTSEKMVTLDGLSILCPAMKNWDLALTYTSTTCPDGLPGPCSTAARWLRQGGFP